MLLITAGFHAIAIDHIEKNGPSEFVNPENRGRLKTLV